MIKRLLISSLTVGITAWMLAPDVTITPWWAAVLVALVLGLVNAVIRPVVKLLSLPITIVTLGLFTLVINALMVLLCTAIIPSYFHVEGFVPAMLFSILLSVVGWLINLVIKK